METQNDMWLRITGKINIANELFVDTDYMVTGAISIYGIDTASKQDGTFNQTFKAQFTDAVELVRGDVVIHAKKKGSQSEKAHHRIVGRGVDYEMFMDTLLKPDVFDEVFKIVERNM